jgi:hypothetical protein
MLYVSYACTYKAAAGFVDIAGLLHAVALQHVSAAPGVAVAMALIVLLCVLPSRLVHLQHECVGLVVIPDGLQ